MAASAEQVPLLTGVVPDAPEWFASALTDVPDRSWISVQGVDVEMLTWGQVGKPGLLFLHGKGAHADWWSFIAPFFSAQFRVVAISWSGMGRSGWREAYPTEILTEEALLALEAGGAFSSPMKPIIVAHSFGSLMAVQLCKQIGGRLRSVVLVDPPMFSEGVIARRRQRWAETAPKAHRLYRSVEDALKRFRFSPYQTCDNLFIADFIARQSLTWVDDGEATGWRWRFDPRHWAPHRQNAIHKVQREGALPFAVILGAESALYTPEDIRYIRGEACPEDTCVVTIPEAAHHVMIDQPIALIATLRAIFSGLPRL